MILRALDEFKATEQPDSDIAADLIREVMASAHAQLGSQFLAGRRIPEIYCRIARDHHRPELDPSDVPMAIIRLADLAVGKLGGSSSGDKEVTLAGTPEAACLDLDEITLAELEIMLEDAQGAAA